MDMSKGGDVMKVIFCSPECTMAQPKAARVFFDVCRGLWDDCMIEVQRVYIKSEAQMAKLRIAGADADDIFIFFNAENGTYREEFIKLLKKYHEARCRIWPIAMERNPECRLPPRPTHQCQSFDVSAWNEVRSHLKDNIPAIAQVFARKVVAQALSPLYRDEVLYFISHRRSDGEGVAQKLSDELSRLTRRDHVFRDVTGVEPGDDAQAKIDETLALSDVLIFLQTEQVQGSSYIMKELCYALVNDIPILWVQIDNAPFSQLRIRPGEGPALSYRSEEFDRPDRLAEIADEIEEKCFQLILNSSNQVCTYIEYLMDLSRSGNICLTTDKSSVLAYEVSYKTVDFYDPKVQRHYIQCFGRHPQADDVERFCSRVRQTEFYQKNDRVFLLSRHADRNAPGGDAKLTRENYDNYIVNIENASGVPRDRHDKRIILSGAFPDCDEIYKGSLLEALSAYAKQILRNGYTLVFGAHPTFQEIIFDIGKLYGFGVRNSIEMHMDRAYVDQYDQDELGKKCSLVLADGLQEMRKNMICKKKAEALICLGGKIKANKADQGVDIEVGLARSAGIPVALVGTVGGRSGEYALETARTGDWSSLNPWGNELNEKLLYSLNHRLMIRKILEKLSGGGSAAMI